MNMLDQKPSDGAPVAKPDNHDAQITDPNRLLALDRVEVMDSPPEEAFDRVVRLATHIIGVPVGLVSFVDGRRQFFKAQQGLPAEVASASETPLTHSFCQYVVSTDAPLAVADAREHPLLRDNLAVRDLDVIAYLGVPIHAPGGETLGSLCAIDGEAHAWSKRDLEVLTDLTAMLETELRLRREKASMRLLATELNHRVKNLFTVVGGMISMTARSAETTSDMAAALQGRLSALSWAHELIRPAVIDSETVQMTIDLDALLTRLLEPHTSGQNGAVEIDVPEMSLSGRAVADLALVAHELATNAAKYGALSVPSGLVRITGSLDTDALVLKWEETGGPEVSEAPSESGFGSKLIQTTVTGQLGGSLVTDWRPSGVFHELRIPATLFSAG